MKNHNFSFSSLLILFLVAMTGINVFGQNLNGKWRTVVTDSGVKATTVMQLNADATGITTLTTVQKTPAAPFILTITTVQTTRFTWQKEENNLVLNSDPSMVSIKVSSKVSGGTTAARAKAQQEANYYAQQYQQQLTDDLNEDFDGCTYTIKSFTTNNLQVLTSDNNKLTFTRVLPQK